jgi:hypothetical protein
VGDFRAGGVPWQRLGGGPHALIDLLDRLDVNPDRERDLGFTVGF